MGAYLVIGLLSSEANMQITDGNCVTLIQVITSGFIKWEV